MFAPWVCSGFFFCSFLLLVVVSQNRLLNLFSCHRINRICAVDGPATDSHHVVFTDTNSTGTKALASVSSRLSGSHCCMHSTGGGSFKSRPSILLLETTTLFL